MTVPMPMSVWPRQQLSLFVPSGTEKQGFAAQKGDAGAAIAALCALRTQLDPVQSALIPAHITLCREDELQDWDAAGLTQVLAEAQAAPLVLAFGPVEGFDGHGLLMPCVGGEDDFQALRRCVLGKRQVRRHAPHLTLAHPRNPRALGNQSALINALPTSVMLSFYEVQHIEQGKAGAAWQLLQRARLGV